MLNEEEEGLKRGDAEVAEEIAERKRRGILDVE